MLNDIIEQAVDFRSNGKIYAQEVNTFRSIAELLASGRPVAKSFDLFDYGLQLSMNYMWVVRDIIDSRIMAEISIRNPTFIDYFNRNMRYLRTGVSSGKNMVWDAVIATAIKGITRHDRFKPVGNIGTVMVLGSTDDATRFEFNQNNPMKLLDTAPLSMSDTEVVLLWISRPAGFEEMMLFLARMVEIHFLVRNQN